MGLTDILSKLDINLEGVLRKVEKQLEELDDKWEIRIDTMAGRGKPFFNYSGINFLNSCC
jgi:hypothetical protein